MARTKSSPALFARRSKPPPPTHGLIATLGGFNPQSSCVLFFGIPPEIRNRIFSFALYSYDDLSRPYPDESYYSCPGYRYHQVTSTNLLITCRRIYSEIHDLPIVQNEHVFWVPGSDGPKRLNPSSNPNFFFQNLTIEQRSAVDHIHLFASVSWLEALFIIFCELKDIHPRYLKITIRLTDWRHWGRPYMGNNAWMKSFNLLEKLEVFDIEVEAMEQDKLQLEEVVTKLLGTRLILAESREMSTSSNTVTRQRYLGHAFYSDGQEYRRYFSKESNCWMNGNPPSPPDQIPYIMSAIRWTANSA